MKTWVLLALVFALGRAWYLPGIAPREFTDQAEVELKVTDLTSLKTHVPFTYYSLPFCQPAQIEYERQNLGEELTAGTIQNSPYKLKMKAQVDCQLTCAKTYSDADIQSFKDAIDDEYKVNWLVDNLPAVIVQKTVDSTQSSEAESVQTNIYDEGFAVGLHTEEGYFLNNHVKLTVGYSMGAGEGTVNTYRVVTFTVEPFSVKHTVVPGTNGSAAGYSCETASEKGFMQIADASGRVVTDKDGKVTVAWTYDVDWEPSEVHWASRWDVYLGMKDSSEDVHYSALVNSVIIMFFLSGMVGLVMLRVLRRDLLRYNTPPSDEEKADQDKEETGWKLVHGDVFRRPHRFPLLFAIVVGTGAQVLLMSLVTLFFSIFGFLSPANRGALMIALLLLYSMAGVVGGYCGGRIHKTLGGREYKRLAYGIAFLFPGVVFLVFFLLNLLLWYYHSDGAVAFGSMLLVLCVWLVVSAPLVWLGTARGFALDPIEAPVRTNEVPRQIPEQPWYQNALLVCVVGGAFPFGAVFVELLFILGSLWQGHYYYMFGFLGLAFVILVIVCAEISIVICYTQLCGEDSRWWWRSIFTPGLSAAYIYVYATIFFFSYLNMTKFVSVMLYFGYTLVISLIFFFVTGTVGFASCYWFVHKIYSSVKIN